MADRAAASGVCGEMLPGSGRGDPDDHAVHDGKDDLTEWKRILAEARERERLIAALREIRRVCAGNNPDGKGDKCALCPLSRADGRCGVVFDIPVTWKLAGDPGPWRAMR